MKISYLPPMAMALFMAACGPSNPDSPTDLNAPRSSDQNPVVSSCADDGERLPKTNICVGRAVNYLNISEGAAPDLPENCSWEVNETEMIGGDFLLYLAAKCDGKKSKLGFSAGAGFADLNLEWSALANLPLPETVLIRVTGANIDRPHENLLAHAIRAMDNKDEAVNCHVRPAEIDGWPQDALVVDNNDSAAPTTQTEPYSACGQFGFDQENTSYWRVFQGFSWWFQLTQDAYHDIDPRSLTVITRSSEGNWAPAE